ncbi:MAG: hypothetical protein ABEH64_03795 [Salinirussus sp.]
MEGRERGQVVTTVDGVTVRKHLEAEAHAVVYELSAEQKAAVRIVESIPSALQPNDLGFVDSDERQPWTIKGPKLVYERSLDAGEEVRTGIAARGEHAAEIEVLLSAPDALEVDPVRESPQGVADRLLEELRADAVSAETRAALREELDTSRPRQSLETRLTQLQSEVADVRAFSNAMEAFLDTHGEPTEVIEQMEQQFERVDAELEAVREQVDSIDTDVEQLEKEMDTRLVDIEEELAEVSDFANTLRGAFSD